jgi:hypothetical protein
MRITARLLPLLGLALAACADAPPAVAQDNARGIVFAVGRGEDGQAVLQPVTVLVPDGFTMPVHEPSDSAMRAFNARWLGAGRSYPVLSRGQRVGTVTPRMGEEPACFGLTASGTLDVRPAPGEGWKALAGEGLPPQPGAPWLRPPSAAEKREMDRMAAALFAAHGVDVADRTRGDTAAATLVVHPNARPVLVASYQLDVQSPVFRRAALLVVAEEGQNGYRPSYAWFHEGVEAAVEARELVDAADLDGDGLPELVVRTTYYESGDFTILRRTEHGWIAVYRGGGGGC